MAEKSKEQFNEQNSLDLLVSSANVIDTLLDEISVGLKNYISTQEVLNSKIERVNKLIAQSEKALKSLKDNGSKSEVIEIFENKKYSKPSKLKG